MRRKGRAPIWLPPSSPPVFPDPADFDAQGLIAGGGDLSSARLIAAYSLGIFPWYDEPPILWWSPDPRSVLTAESLHVSRSLARTLRKTSFEVTCGVALRSVMEGCAARPEGTWLKGEMQDAYAALEAGGHALSYEVWDRGELVGGLYGVSLGALYAAESKFHRATDASKIALVCALSDFCLRGGSVFDVQFTTPHLASLGVHEVPRATYLDRVAWATKTVMRPPARGKNLLPDVLAWLDAGRP